MEELLAEVRTETVSVNAEDVDKDGVGEQSQNESFRHPSASKKKPASNRRVYVEKSTRFVQIDVNKLRYLLDEKKRVRGGEDGDEGRGLNPLLDWAVGFQKSWGTWTLFLAGLLAGFGAFQLVLVSLRL
jgi:hypothetical protein